VCCVVNYPYADPTTLLLLDLLDSASALTRVFSKVCEATVQDNKGMFIPTQQQIVVTSTLVCCALLWFAVQQKNRAVSLIYLISLGFAVILYARASYTLRETLRQCLALSGKSGQNETANMSSQPLLGAYQRSVVMVHRVLMFIASTVATVPVYALLVPESRAAGLGVRPAVLSILPLTAIKLEFGIVVASIAVYCVEPYRRRVEISHRRLQVKHIKVNPSGR
jgi:hypothetical protein